MKNEINELARPLIERAITEYAGIFKGIAEEDAHEAAARLERLRELDKDASESLTKEAYLYYEQQRNTLIKRFGEKLIVKLEDQLQGDMIESARSLVQQIETVRTKK